MNHLSRAGAVLHTSYALLVALVFFAAFYAWHVRCEGYGCFGLSLLWLAWLGLLFAPVLCLGAFLAFGSGPRGRLAKGSRWLFAAQIALGLVLAGIWLVKRYP